MSGEDHGNHDLGEKLVVLLELLPPLGVLGAEVVGLGFGSLAPPDRSRRHVRAAEKGAGGA